MSRRRIQPFAALAAAVLLPWSATAQQGQGAVRPARKAEPATPAATSTPPKKHFVQLRYPRDKEAVLAMVDGTPLHLEDLVRHMDEVHSPGFRRLLAGADDRADDRGTPEGARILESDLIAPWVRHYADCRALELEAKEMGPFDPARVKDCAEKALTDMYAAFLEQYLQGLAAQGHPTDLSDKRQRSLRRDFQLRSGFAAELQGWLDFLEPTKDWSNQRMHDFFQENSKLFGGGVTIAHILVQHRDAGTGILLDQESRARALSRLDEIKRRLRPDGSNFEEVAAWGSEDTKSAASGGVLRYIERFDARLPPAICRAAWSLQDGAVSDVVESPFGLHIIRRIEHEQRLYLLFSEATETVVRTMMQRVGQEDLLFRVRAKHRVELRI